MATVSFKGATRVYPGSDTPAVDGLDLDIADGEFMVPREVRGDRGSSAGRCR